MLDEDGFKVFGINISSSFIEMSKKRVPNVDFINESFYDAQIPSCKCTISTSECFNYASKENDDIIMLFKKYIAHLIQVVIYFGHFGGSHAIIIN